MGNARSNKKTVFFFVDMKNEDEQIIFFKDMAYPVEDGLIKNDDNLSIGIEDIWVDFRVEFQTFG